MSDLDAFLRAILAAPDDEAPRKVLADCLEEHRHAKEARRLRLPGMREHHWGGEIEEVKDNKRTLLYVAEHGVLNWHPHDRRFASVLLAPVPNLRCMGPHHYNRIVRYCETEAAGRYDGLWLCRGCRFQLTGSRGQSQRPLRR